MRLFIVFTLFAAAFVLFVLGLTSVIAQKNLFIFPWWAVAAYVLGLAITSFVSIRGPANVLWRALKADYPGSPIDRKTWPQSAGIFGTTEINDISTAVTFADKRGIHVCRYRKYLKMKTWIKIPWSRVESVEIMRPNKNAVEAAESRTDRKIFSSFLTAKVKLLRDRIPMTLILPWNQEFGRYAPPNVEIIKKWEWPYSVV